VEQSAKKNQTFIAQGEKEKETKKQRNKKLNTKFLVFSRHCYKLLS
jgi:hypothetical protein